MHYRTNNDKKVAGVIALLPICHNFEMCQCKINTAIDTVKTLAQAYFEEHCADEEGNITIATILKLVEARIAVKEGGAYV